MIWLNVPRPPCFKGTVMKNVVQSLENTGSSFWGGKRINDKYISIFRHIHTVMNSCCHVEHVTKAGCSIYSLPNLSIT